MATKTKQNSNESYLILEKIAQELMKYNFEFDLSFRKNNKGTRLEFSGSSCWLSIDSKADLIFNQEETDMWGDYDEDDDEHVEDEVKIGNLSDPEIFNKTVEFMIKQAIRKWNT